MSDWFSDTLQPRTDRLYADVTPQSGLLPVERPWLFRIGDIVRLASGEMVQIVDGFLHVRRGIGGYIPGYAPADSPVVIIASASAEGSRL